MSRLTELYKEGGIERKRKIIGSMYPEKLVFDGFGFRTTRVNQALEIMCLIHKGLKVKKKWDKFRCF